MKEPYEDRLQRAKNKLNQERARRKNREAVRDDASYSSERSKSSRTSFASEFSRSSSKFMEKSKVPRSEWRNKARAVIERGKNLKDQELELLRDAHNSGSGRTPQEREAQIDSLVERNACLNERERMLKVESELLDAAEAAAKADDLERAESYLGKDIEDHDNDTEEDESLHSDSRVTASRTADNRAKRIRENEADDLNRSFQAAKSVWLGRCKTDSKPATEHPTPVKTNSFHRPATAEKSHASKNKDKRTAKDGKERITLENLILISDIGNVDKKMNNNTPESPASVKSGKSTRSARSTKSAKPERVSNSRGKPVGHKVVVYPDSPDSAAKSEQNFGDNGKVTKHKVVAHPSSPESPPARGIKTKHSVVAYPSSPESVGSDYKARAKETNSLWSKSFREDETRDENENAGIKRNDRRNSHSSHRQKLVDPLASFERDREEEEPTPKKSYRVQSASVSVSSQISKFSSQRNSSSNCKEKAENEENGKNHSYRVHSSSASVSSQRSKYASHRNHDDHGSSASVASQRSKHSSHQDREEHGPSSSATISSQRSKYSSDRGPTTSCASVSSKNSKYSAGNNKHEDRGPSSSTSVASRRSKHSHRDDAQEDDEEDIARSSRSVTSQRSKYSSRHDTASHLDDEDEIAPSSRSVTSQRSKHSSHHDSSSGRDDEERMAPSSRSVRSQRSKHSSSSHQDDEERIAPSSRSVTSQRSKHSSSSHQDDEERTAPSSRSVTSQRSKYSSHHDSSNDRDDGDEIAPSSRSVTSQRSKYSSHHDSSYHRDDEDEIAPSSRSVTSQRSKYSSHHDSSSRRDNEDEIAPSSRSVTSQRSKYSSHRNSSNASVSSQRSKRSSRRSNRDDRVPSSGASVSSHRSRRSRCSRHHEEVLEDPDDHEDEFDDCMPPSELTIPLIIADLENTENQPPRKRELSYREKSAMLASMENNPVEAVESGIDEEPSLVAGRNVFHQLGQKAKNHKRLQSPYLSSNKKFGAETQSQPAAVGLKEQKNLYNNAKSERKFGTSANNTQVHQESESFKLNNLANENKELRARLEKERTRRSELDDKTTNLQLEVHKKGQEISQLKMKKDVSATHKEQLYKMEDALHETNRHLVVVVDENVKLREEVEEERARRCRLESQSKQTQTKLKRRSDEVVALAKELKKKEDRFNESLMEERRLREVAEKQLASACLHINNSEKERNEEMEELYRQNEELRHTVERLEAYLQKKLVKERKNNAQMRRRSGESQQGVINKKPTWTSTVSEITTDFEYNELNNSQMGEI
ncbi:expressed unknown protein [Seminavis robusta]|uniref:Uncharacterized protein n=1 Tax=Seminavis robusta TaxID=568900 RepID=A0A9N8DY38_9STRA|nr:expressed unknown protein [Seminavis robusta]|eukprot:Sro459_g147340.1 n/a (1273) ;mRNA; r:45826-49644